MDTDDDDIVTRLWLADLDHRDVYHLINDAAAEIVQLREARVVFVQRKKSTG